MQLINDIQLEHLLDTSPEERVTGEDIVKRIVRVKWTLITDKMTVCVITLDNGFSVTGESSCVSKGNYNQSIGERIAYDNAFDKLWPLFGFLLAEKQFRSKK